ncbi:hypothetical protein A6A08_12835 [Nocardiopsis sp. TSRI0078]|uniref:hypothetical protein n=1 Tax=unclassified Nocardiopsis TaxID=2649073 RepID=UPI00093D2AFA|nr:hypothetical protein [Nocardiopsis sp. TSRI0078]OKI14462.1 hypothetical protein A6A08_12835 [Nocardiopsis sp. TSRI0078]
MSGLPASPPAFAPALTHSTGAVWTMVAAAVMYPLLVGAVLWVGGLLALLDVLHYGWGYTASLGVVTLALTGAGHHLLLRTLHCLHVPRPWEFPVVLSTAVLMAGAQAMVALVLDLITFMLLPVICLALSLLGCAVWTASRRSPRFSPVLPLSPVVAVALLLSGTWWMGAEEKLRQERDELLRDTAAFPSTIAVLDSAGWRPSTMLFSHSLREAGIIVEDEFRQSTTVYVPAEPSPGLDGFSLTLNSLAKEDAGDRRLHQGCEAEGGTWTCEEHGDTVIATVTREGAVEMMEARKEFAGEVVAILSANLPRDDRGNPTLEFPGIDMAELAERVRPENPGEAEEIAFTVTD